MPALFIRMRLFFLPSTHFRAGELIMLMLMLSERFSHTSRDHFWGLHYVALKPFFSVSFVVMQHGFCMLLMCCHLLPFLGFLPPTPFSPPRAGGGNVQCIYLYSVSKARKHSFNRQPYPLLLGMCF